MEFRSVNKLLESSFKTNWEREALSNYNGETLCYKDVAESVARLHVCFKQIGMKRGDKVSLCSRNQANWSVTFLAALTYGAVPVPILHEFKVENIHNLVNHSESKVFFAGQHILDDVSESEMPNLQAIVRIDDLDLVFCRDYDAAAVKENVACEFAKLYPNGFSPNDISYTQDKPDELALINYTSGTSGFSKGVMLPYRALWSNISFAYNVAEPQLNCESEVVAMLPSAHMYGMMFEFLFQMTIGSHVHYLTRVPSPKIIMNAFKEIRPDIIIAVPLIIEKVYKLQIKPIADRSKPYLSLPILGTSIQKKFRNNLIDAFGGRFEEIILGGAPFNPEAESFLRKVHFPFTVGYGMTECAPLITYAKWYRSKAGSCGVPITDCKIRIDSSDPERIPGEIQVKGPNVFLGYFKNPEATKASFTRDGWFKTGDMGVIDQDGYLFLRGRLKCMILGPSGQNIYPEELEAVINNASYVIDSLVIEDNGGLTALIYPDFRQGELDGMTHEELSNRIIDNLPGINKFLPVYAQIRKIEIMPEDFERTPKKSIKRYLYQRD